MLSKHIFLAACLGMTLAVMGCKKDEATEPTSSAQVITPGVGINNLKIGDPAQKAIDLYGTPLPSYGSAGGNYTHFLIYGSKGAVVYCEPTTVETFNAQMKIARLKFSSPFNGKTDKGIGFGSTKADVKAAYGDPVSSSPFFGDEYAIGITFIYEDNSDKVESIEVE